MDRWRYFKIGDVVADPEVWGSMTFIVRSLHGNDYCPLLAAESVKLIRGRRIRVNLSIDEARLVNAAKRPLKNLPDATLFRLAEKTSEARRELLIRSYCKQNGKL